MPSIRLQHGEAVTIETPSGDKIELSFRINTDGLTRGFREPLPEDLTYRTPSGNTYRTYEDFRRAEAVVTKNLAREDGGAL